ncbi:MAG: hypothetical protein FD138_1066 [Planctomycetota bacterium]|nr:MAG: hypothetical protein FD138_1066 [Planctomycetota bacterium]
MRNGTDCDVSSFVIFDSPLPGYPVCSASSAFQKSRSQATILLVVADLPKWFPRIEVLNCLTTPVWN